MRILLLTDSLGCPRKEIDVTDTWTYRIIKKWSNSEHVFYTYCEHGLISSKINVNYIEELQPDIVVSQIGIVDSCRRIMSRNELYIISKLPLLSRMIHRFCRKYHYQLTKIRKVHYTSLVRFESVVAQIFSKSRLKYIFISIAPPGDTLQKKVHHVYEDILAYNNVAKCNPKIIYLDPYERKDINEILLNDGHHLTKRGHDVVFDAVDNTLTEILKEANIQ